MRILFVCKKTTTKITTLFPFLWESSQLTSSQTNFYTQG